MRDHNGVFIIGLTSEVSFSTVQIGEAAAALGGLSLAQQHRWKKIILEIDS